MRNARSDMTSNSGPFHDAERHSCQWPGLAVPSLSEQVGSISGGGQIRGENAAKDSSRREPLTGTSGSHDPSNWVLLIGREATSTAASTNDGSGNRERQHKPIDVPPNRPCAVFRVHEMESREGYFFFWDVLTFARLFLGGSR